MTSADVLVVEPNRTVRRIVERTLRAEGYAVRGCADGGEALALCERSIPSVLLVEEALAPTALLAHPALRGVPIVTMSVRSGAAPLGETDPRDPVGRATALLPKPFAPEALVATLVATLARSEARPSLSPAPDHDGPPTRERLLVGEVGLGHEDALSGRIEHIPLPDVIQLLATQQQTGTLEVKSGEHALAVGLTRGRIDLVVGRGLADTGLRLGRHLLSLGLVERRELERALAEQKERRTERTRRDAALRLGAMLIARGALSRDGLARALTTQTNELLVELLRFERGTFRFVRSLARAEAADAQLGLAIAPLLLDAVRRIDEWRLLEAKARSLEAVLEIDPTSHVWRADEELRAEDRALLEAVDGEHALRTHASALDDGRRRGTSEGALVESALRLLAMRALRLARQD